MTKAQQIQFIKDTMEVSNKMVQEMILDPESARVESMVIRDSRATREFTIDVPKGWLILSYHERPTPRS